MFIFTEQVTVDPAVTAPSLQEASVLPRCGTHEDPTASECAGGSGMLALQLFKNLRGKVSGVLR